MLARCNRRPARLSPLEKICPSTSRHHRPARAAARLDHSRPRNTNRTSQQQTMRRNERHWSGMRAAKSSRPREAPPPRTPCSPGKSARARPTSHRRTTRKLKPKLSACASRKLCGKLPIGSSASEAVSMYGVHSACKTPLTSALSSIRHILMHTCARVC